MMVKYLLTAPRWVHILLFVPAYLILSVRKLGFKIRYNYVRLRNKFAIYVINRRVKKRDMLIAQIRKLILIFVDKGNNSKYIPRSIKTHAQMRDHIYKHYGKKLNKMRVIITPALKIKQL
ncbi:hypothetical protein [Nonlabens dokdonensis]|uniref:hypothetical protein n=1 Tax=Nonlabens dokdonensis TaxID=328515 RepID=UPI0026EFFDD7|nr:hypothetical protein [Nonlabens dokdonensis]